jgi:hypothetical protein
VVILVVGIIGAFISMLIPRIAFGRVWSGEDHLDFSFVFGITVIGAICLSFLCFPPLGLTGILPEVKYDTRSSYVLV